MGQTGGKKKKLEQCPWLPAETAQFKKKKKKEEKSGKM